MIRKMMLFPVILSVAVLFAGCGQKIDPQPYILQADKDITSANTPEISKYASDLLKEGQDALNEAKSIVQAHNDKDYERAIALATKAQIYAKVSQIMAESKSKSDAEVSTAKESEAKAKAEIELIKASLQRAKRIIPSLKTEIEKMLKELDTLFDEKPEGEKVQ